MDYQYQAVEQPSNPRKTWPIVLSVVVALTVVCGAGVYVYHNKRQEALDTCRQSLAEFSSARKAVLDTSENGSELQKLIRGALGVNDIIDEQIILQYSVQYVIGAIARRSFERFFRHGIVG